MKIAAIVVVYNPALDSLIDNILSYVDKVDYTLIYQNSKIDVCRDERLRMHRHKIFHLGDGENLGIAAALNSGVGWAKDNNMTHLLTFDQDSSFVEGHLSNFLELITKSQIKNAGIYCPNISNHGKLVFKSTDDYLIVADSITSGSVFPMETFARGGVFNEDLFIDAVDYEFCYRIKYRHELKTVLFPAVILQHEVGDPTKIRFGLKSDNYSSVRIYYIIRNHILVWKKYPNLFQKPYKITLVKRHIIYRFIKIMIGEEKKLEKLKAIFNGLVDGITGRIK